VEGVFPAPPGAVPPFKFLPPPPPEPPDNPPKTTVLAHPPPPPPVDVKVVRPVPDKTELLPLLP
jgi:hypothetical protein